MWRYIHARTIPRIVSRVQRPAPDHSIEADRFLRRLIEARADVSALQIGSYDGVSNDPFHDLIREYGHVRAVLLEPQPAPYAALARRWAGIARVNALQCALADTCGERQLFVIADEFKHLHPFPDQVASFLRSQVEFALSRYAWRPRPDAIRSIAVPTLDWPTLVRTYGRFDVVVIDAEGYDAEILQQIDFSTGPPDVILYEHRCLSRRVQGRCRRFLTSKGYAVGRLNNADTMASRVGLPERIPCS